MVFTAFRAIEGTRGENPLIYMIFRRYRYHSAIIISRIQPDIAVERNSRQAKAENSTENRILHWFLKGIFIFAQWFWGPQLVLYKWLWSKLSNYSMIFRPKMHDFGTYLTIVKWGSKNRPSHTNTDLSISQAMISIPNWMKIQNCSQIRQPNLASILCPGCLFFR